MTTAPATSTADAIVLTRHAVERYQQRVRPGLTVDQARTDLRRLAAAGTITTEPPAWLGRAGETPAVRYLTVGDVVLPLARAHGRLIALTCIPRGAISQTTRGERNDSRAHHHPERPARRPYRRPRDLLNTPTVHPPRRQP